MKKILLISILLVVVASLTAVELKSSGSIRTRAYYYNTLVNDADLQESMSAIDTRLRLKLSSVFDENIKAVLYVEYGDGVWGNHIDFGNDEKALEVKQAYMEWKTPMGCKLKIGAIGWKDHMGLVLYQDFAGFLMERNINEDLMMSFGMAKIQAVGGDHEDDSNEAFLLNAYYKKMYGAEMIVQRSMMGKKMDIYFMPHAVLDVNENMKIDAMFALNYGSHKEAVMVGTEMKDVSNMGYAFVMKAAYTDGYKLGLDFMYTSGDDGEDPESTSVFNTLEDYYMNGLEIYGFGCIDTMASSQWNRPGNNGNGYMNIVLSASYPVNEKHTARFALGLINSVEEINKETAMGTEIDLGLKTKLHKKLTLDTFFAYAMPGDAVWIDAEPITKFGTRLQFTW